MDAVLSGHAGFQRRSAVRLAGTGAAESRAGGAEKYPDIKFEDYVHGALAFSADAKAQYENMMAFPPFESEIDKGRQLWETPFKNGKLYADCFPGGGRNVAGNYPYYDETMKKWSPSKWHSTSAVSIMVKHPTSKLT